MSGVEKANIVFSPFRVLLFYEFSSPFHFGLFLIHSFNGIFLTTIVRETRPIGNNRCLSHVVKYAGIEAMCAVPGASVPIREDGAWKS